MNQETMTIQCGIPKQVMDEVNDRIQVEEISLRDFVADALRHRMALSMEQAAKVRRQADAYGVTCAEFIAAAVDAYDPAKAKLKQTRGKNKAAK